MISYFEVESLYYTYKRSMPGVDSYTIRNKVIEILIYKYSYRNYNEIISMVNMLCN